MKSKITSLFRGENLNHTEDRPVLFHLMRGSMGNKLSRMSNMWETTNLSGSKCLVDKPTPHFKKVTQEWNEQYPKLIALSKSIREGT